MIWRHRLLHCKPFRNCPSQCRMLSSMLVPGHRIQEYAGQWTQCSHNGSPGTPGAATMQTPSNRMKFMNRPKSCGIPDIIVMASAQAVIFIAEPGMCMVAQSGTVNPAMSSLTPFLRVWRRVTGMVAAEDDVPSAVKYAGTMFQSNLNGFFLRPRQQIQKDTVV
jgi:hypothetical protein